MRRIHILIFLVAICGCYSNVRPQLSRIDIFQPNFHQTQRYRDTRSVEEPSLEVLMHLPPGFKDVNAFRKFLGVKPERRRRSVPDEEETTKPKREASAAPEPTNVASTQLLVEGGDENQPFASPLMIHHYPDEILRVEETGPGYMNFDRPNPDEDPNDPRKRRNTSANDHEDSKRSYPDPQDSTTPMPFWKQSSQKKTSPPFVTQREGRQNGYDQQQPQHRSQDNGRESHSMKDPKSMSSNEIPRLQDNYYASSNPSTRRTYNSRQSDSTSPPPKSVYDTIDYSNPRRGAARNVDPRGRLTTDSYSYSRSYSFPGPYDRGYYPLPGEYAPRGVDYYHRTMDPGTGRIVYYANLPEPSPSYDPLTGRPRTYPYDAYGRSFPVYPGYPNYSAYQGYPTSDYLRNGRNVAEPYQQQRYELDRYRDDYRNKTYVIFDAEEKRPAVQRPYDSRNRYTPPVLPYPGYQNFPNYPAGQPGYFGSPAGYQPYPFRNQYYPDVRGIVSGDTAATRDVQLPLTSRRAIGSYDKTSLKPLKP